MQCHHTVAGSLRRPQANHFEFVIEARMRRLVSPRFYLTVAFRLLKREGKQALSAATILVSRRTAVAILRRLATETIRRSGGRVTEAERYVSRRQADRIQRQLGVGVIAPSTSFPLASALSQGDRTPELTLA